MRLAIALAPVLVAACGRFGFDGHERANADGAVPEDDAPSPLDDDASPPPDVNLSAGLIASFSFDGTMADSASARVGSCAAGECPIDAPGRIGGGYAFDGVDDCITVPDEPALRPAQVTLAVWAKHTAPLDNQSYIAKATSSTNHVNSWQLEVGAESMVGAVAFTTWDGMGTANHFTMSAPNTLVLDRWYHFAGTWDGVTKRLYIDGVEHAFTTFAGPPLYGALAVTIGCDENSTNHDLYFEGVLDDVRIYDRALSAAEIAALAAQ